MSKETPQPNAGETESPTAKLPDASELAQLSAILNQGLPINAHRAAELARDALLLFQACQKLLDERAKRAKFISETASRLARSFSTIKSPAKWPATLDDFLRLVVGGKDKAERLPRYRRFLCHLVRADRWSGSPNYMSVPFESTPSVPFFEVAPLLERDKQRDFTESEYLDLAHSFVVWHNAERKKTNREKARKGGLAKGKHLQAGKPGESSSKNKTAVT